MGIREQAALDARTIIEDSTDGFGWPVTVISPAGLSRSLTGLTTDIGRTIDPETGQAVSARHASATLSIAALTEAGLAIPQGVADASSKPWIIEFEDTAGNMQSFKVSASLPDRAVGLVVLHLEAIRRS
jgi:hypothetical protein